MKTKLSGNSCPLPGSVPKGNWTCKEQEIPITGTSFLDEDAQTYPGKLARPTKNLPKLLIFLGLFCPLAMF